MKTYVPIKFLFVVTCTFGFGCEDKTANVTSLTLYNTIAEDKNFGSYDLKAMGKYHKQTYTDQKVLELIKSAKPSNELFLWRGYIVGAFSYKNNDTILVKISRYGGFFSIHNRVYEFNEEKGRSEWGGLINEFVDKWTRETPHISNF